MSEGIDDKWDVRFMRIAQEVSSWSKDPSTKVGCVFVKDRRILSTGYNGFPQGLSDAPELYANRELKYSRTVHAEANGIYNANSFGGLPEGTTLYVWGLPPCIECSKALIRVKTSRVVVPNQVIPETWFDSCSFGEQLFKEAGVILTALHLPYNK